MADIHGNMPAFRAVLADAEACGAEKYIFLGDYCNHLSGSREVVELLRGMGNAHVIAGNEDYHIAGRRGQDQATWTDGQFLATYWTFRQFDEAGLDFLEELPEELQILLAGGLTAKCFHKPGHTFPGTVLEQFSSSGFEEENRKQLLSVRAYGDQLKAQTQADEPLRRILQQEKADIFLCAHFHVPFSVEIEGKLVLNPGSVGLPMTNGQGANYALLDCADGQWQVEHRFVPYDVEQTIANMHTSGLYEAAPLWSEIIEEEVRAQMERVVFFLRHMWQYAREQGETVYPYTKEFFAAGYAHWREKSPYPTPDFAKKRKGKP